MEEEGPRRKRRNEEKMNNKEILTPSVYHELDSRITLSWHQFGNKGAKQMVNEKIKGKMAKRGFGGEEEEAER